MADGLPGLPARYRDLGPIGAGGMGEVRRVHDAELDRVVALKVVRADLGPDGVEQLRREARTTARLDHPAIVAVHDLGMLDDGRLWFTMREVRGQTLASLLASEERPRLRRLLDLLAQVGRAVAWAHRSGVVHRDLKPDNVMVGPFGEVQVMDWGLGWTLGDGSLGDEIAGTPAYMAPEQARGQPELVGPATDVYALGAVLYEMLGGLPPHRGDAMVPTLVRAFLARPTALPEGAAPGELAALAERAMCEAPADRPSAAELVDALERWLDGEHRREEALALVDQARKSTEALDDWEKDLWDTMERARALLASLPTHAGPEAKAEVWEAEDRAARLAEQVDLAEIDVLEHLYGALTRHPDLPEAHAALAEHHQRQLARAQRRRDRREAARRQALMLRHDDGRFARWLEQTTRVTLVTDPPGARVMVMRCEVQGRRLVEVFDRMADHTPTVLELGHGSWVLDLEHPSGARATLPLSISPDSQDPLIPPRAHEPLVIPLLTGLAEDDRYVPAGWFQLGGDHLAVDGFPLTLTWVDGFVMRRDPVTNGEYLAFLEYVDRPELAPGALERSSPIRPWRRTANGWTLPDDEPHHHPDRPVTFVDLACAEAYCAWRAARDGLPWRLPTELEWEKAARGVDGRLWPWGDHLEPAWARMVTTQATPALALPEEHPLDVGVYGIRGMAGNVRDWTASHWPGNPSLRIVRGGAWASVEAMCRPAGRLANRASDRFHNCGFRLARSV
ncbi:MAG: SUMF1/EgtB/PvdO family nonheme iron enzyme [Alphaproteobacteria bacterium]|nr:SUMF1/EgtB/PvdO family nonheme iron enzyme [Alphaproteobacteria bacterium]